jgi:hypothetical protein
MADKYRATIHGNTIEWDGEPPAELNGEDEVSVEVTVLAPQKRKPNGKRMAEALRRIAERGGIPSIPDPVKWQREIRKDRKLPGRE